MSDPNVLLHAAAEWFTMAIRQHVAEAPHQAQDWLRLFEHGEARAVVSVEVVPTPQITCSFQLEDHRLIVFHRVPLHERQPAPEKLN